MIYISPSTNSSNLIVADIGSFDLSEDGALTYEVTENEVDGTKFTHELPIVIKSIDRNHSNNMTIEYILFSNIIIETAIPEINTFALTSDLGTIVGDTNLDLWARGDSILSVSIETSKELRIPPTIEFDISGERILMSSSGTEMNWVGQYTTTLDKHNKMTGAVYIYIQSIGGNINSYVFPLCGFRINNWFTWNYNWRSS